LVARREELFLVTDFGGDNRGPELFVLARHAGRLRKLSGKQLKVGAFSLSPNGREIAMEGSSGSRDWEIYVMHADGSALRQLTDSHAYDVGPQWSPDGRRIVFTSYRDGNAQIYVMNADGSGQTNFSRSHAGDESPTWVPVRR